MSNYGNYSWNTFRKLVIPNSVDGINDEKIEYILVFCISGAMPLNPAWILMFSLIRQSWIPDKIFHYA